MVFDNSRLNSPPNLMLVFATARLIKADLLLAEWALRACQTDLLLG